MATLVELINEIIFRAEEKQRKNSNKHINNNNLL